MRVLTRAGCLLVAALGLAPPASADFTIAVSAPLSGPLSQLGRGVQDGVEAAVAAINAGGGVLGQQLVVTIADDRCEAETAAAVAAEIVAGDALLVVGPICSVAAIAAAPVYADGSVAMITPGAPEPRLTGSRAGPGIFRLFGRSDEQAPTAATHLFSRFGDQPIAVFDDDTRYGNDLADAVRLGLTELGIELALVDTFNRTDPRTAELVDRLELRSIAAVYVGSYPDGLAALALEIDRRGLPVILLGPDTMADPAYLEEAGPAADGTRFTYQPDLASLPSAADAVAAIESAGGEADGMALGAFAAVQVWAEAAAAAGSADFARVAPILGSRTFTTVIGPVSFDDDGNLDQPGWVVYEWVGRRMQPAE